MRTTLKLTTAIAALTAFAGPALAQDEPAPRLPPRRIRHGRAGRWR